MISNLSLELSLISPVTLTINATFGGIFHLTYACLNLQTPRMHIATSCASLFSLQLVVLMGVVKVAWCVGHVPGICVLCLSMPQTPRFQPFQTPSFALCALLNDFCPCFNYSVNLPPANNARSLIPFELFPSGTLPASATPRPSLALAPDQSVVRPGQRAWCMLDAYRRRGYHPQGND